MDSLPCGHSRELFKFMDDLIIHAKDKIEKPIDTDRIRHIEAKVSGLFRNFILPVESMIDAPASEFG